MASLAQQWKQEGIQQGVQQGIYQGKLDVARAMLREKQDINFIAKLTGLTVKQIKELQ